MRLLNVDTFTFTEFFGIKPPSYAIASHRWLAGTEAMWEDIHRRKKTSQVGYLKVVGFVDYVKKQLPLVKWLWIDTCCIKQQSDRELSEAINSMFRWYREAEVCLAYLEDVPTSIDITAFEHSVWFRRGWTLQELLAPSVVIFLSKNWQVVGHKGHAGQGRSGITMDTGPSLMYRISGITGIAEAVLQDYDNARDLNTKDKLKWMQSRNTTREEDLSYCLLGILDVSMNIRYGDGDEKTRKRLMEKVSSREALIQNESHDDYRIEFNLAEIPTTDHFVKREADMQHLTAFFASEARNERQQVFVVFGMGGTGKTQLCAEFARTNKLRFGAIFWFDGSSKDALERSMAQSALRLPKHNDPLSVHRADTQIDDSQLRSNLLRWLAQRANTGWLIVIDNVDREWQQNAKDPQAYNYRDYLPHADHGSVLITTRLSSLQRPQASLNLESVDRKLAKEMLEIRAGGLVEGIDVLLDMLGGLPLALVQAGAYLRETGTTVADYMEYYKNTWEDLMQSQSRSLLQENGGESVLTIWKMSYEQIKSTDMLAAKLLDLWAFLHRDDVWPELVLTSQANSELLGLVESSSFIRATKLSLTNSIGTLARFSMINRGTSSRSHSIHPVVHTWCLHNLTTPVARNEMLAIAVSLVAQMIQVLPEDVTRHTKLRLAAHAKTVGSRMESLTVSTELADDCDQIATFLAGWEKSDEVETLYRQALLGKERHLGPDHLSTLQTVNKLGNLYAGQGKTGSAEEMYQRALQGKENTLGPEHTQTLATVNNLGLLYADQGKMAAAEDMYKRALQGYENAFGPDHTSTLVMVNNLGILYRNTAKTAEAEEMYQRALRGKEKACGPEHTSTLYTVINLGNLYADLGKTAAAEEMYQRALKGYEKVWGPEHTSTLDTLDNLGDLYRKQGRQTAAEEMYQRALAGYESMSRTPKVEARVTQIRASLSSVRVDVTASVSEPARETRPQSTSASTQNTTSDPHLEPTPSIPRKGLRQAVLALRNRSWSLSSTR